MTEKIVLLAGNRRCQPEQKENFDIALKYKIYFVAKQ